MTDDELRRLVREAVARHLGRTAAPVPVLPEATRAAAPASSGGSWQGHPSHYQYLAVVNTTNACVIEPAVPCDHCGYCKSHGH